MADKKPIGQDIILRVTGALKSLSGVTGSQSWMGPGELVQPVITEEQAEHVAGRAFDFPVGTNTTTRPRTNETVTFGQMRALSEACDVLRLVIETRKDQIARLKFNIKPKDEDVDPDEGCKEIWQFMQKPDGENNWTDWVKQLTEEMLVTDAATIYPWLTNGGDPYRFELVDGSTIKRVIDGRGRTPAPPEPAYQQILKGVPALNYTSDELIYAPRNKRIHKIYGYSPVEQIITTVNISLRRSIHQLQYYTEGSTPDLLFQVPVDWDMAAIKAFNEWWELTLAGNTASRRKAQFVPNGVTPINTKESILKDSFDEWLARIVCYALSVSPQPFIKEMNKSTADSNVNAALSEGQEPLKIWIKGVIDDILSKYFNRPDLEFIWDENVSIKPEEQAKIDDINLKNGSKLINEIRSERGDSPYDNGNVPMVLTSAGYVPIDPNTENIESEDIPPPDEDEDEDEEALKLLKRNEDGSINGINRDTPRHIAILLTFTNELGRKFKKLKVPLIKDIISAYSLINKSDALNDILDDANWSGWGELEDLFGTHITTSVTLGVEEAAIQLDLDNPVMFELANEKAIEYANNRAAELVGMRITAEGDTVVNPNPAYSIQSSTRDMLRSTISHALEDGWSNDKLAKELESNYAFSKKRALVIARTETALADIEGNLVLYAESNVVQGKQWIVGAECCDECKELDGKVVDLDKEFSNGNFAPPLHPNCRCDILPVLIEEEKD